MKFIVDEQLPIILAEWLIEKGYDTIHVNTLATQKPISDIEIRKLSMTETRVVISKDEDFFNSYLIHKEPFKLIFLTTGNIKNRALLDIFRANLSNIINLISKHDLIEIKKDFMKVWH